jgi:ABC-type bacteriocin/lantibiotic exporter with double-glycine peptidase domain
MVLFITLYKIIVGLMFSGKSILFEESKTSYDGIATGEYKEYIQQGKETCGYAVIAFFLSNVGILQTENDIVQLMGKDTMLSLSEMESTIKIFNLKTQILKINPNYFRKRPETAILHFSNQHFVIFIREENNTALIFDPFYGLVYVTWENLLKQFSGYMLYVYK